jgi:hypothetical protein
MGDRRRRTTTTNNKLLFQEGYKQFTNVSVSGTTQPAALPVE